MLPSASNHPASEPHEGREPLTKSEVTEIITTSINDSLADLYKKINDSYILPMESRIARQSDRIKLLEVAVGSAGDDRREIRDLVSENSKQIKALAPEMAKLAAVTREAINDYKSLFDRVNDERDSFRQQLHLQESRLNGALGQDSDIVQRLNKLDGTLIKIEAHRNADSDRLAKIERGNVEIALLAEDIRKAKIRVARLLKSKKFISVVSFAGAYVAQALGIHTDLIEAAKSIQTFLGL